MQRKVVISAFIFVVTAVICAPSDKDGDLRRVSDDRRGREPEKIVLSTLTKLGDKTATVVSQSGNEAAVTSTFLGRGASDKAGANGVGKPPSFGQTSLVVVFDGTLSMFDDLQQLKSGAKVIINEILARESNPIYNYIFVPFRDPVIGPKVVTMNQDLFLEAIDKMEIYGGGDCPESAVRGIEMALESALPKSFVFVFTDAIANDFQFEDRILHIIQAKQATVLFLLTGFCNSKSEPGYEIYEKIAETSNGQVFDLNKKDIEQVLVSVRDMLDSRYVPLKLIKSNSAAVQTHELKVDDNLKEFSVSVAGQKPDITVFSPSKEAFTNQTVAVDNLKMINIHEPESGNWNIMTRSQSKHSIRITGISELTFDFGFSLNPVQFINESSYTPMQGKSNLLSIQASGADFSGQLNHVKILIPASKDTEEFSFKLPLSLNPISSLYQTPQFQPPRAAFQMSIEGSDNQGHPIERILSTLIKSVAEAPPELFLTSFSSTINTGDVLEVICTVQSLVPVQVTLEKDHQTVETNHSNSNTQIVVSKVAEIKDSGEYSCRAQNEFGLRDKSIQIIVTELNFTVDIPEHFMAIQEGSRDFEIPCHFSSSGAEIRWNYNNSKIQDDGNFLISRNGLIIKSVTRNLSGIYECAGQFRSHSAVDFVILDVEYPVALLENVQEKVLLKFGEARTISCPINGNPKPDITWLEYSGEINTDNEIVIDKMTAALDKSRFVCQGSSPISLDLIRHSFTLNLPVLQHPNTQIVQESPLIKHDREANFRCECTDCLPIQEAFWTVDGIPIDSSEGLYNLGESTDLERNKFTSNLTIKSLIATTKISCVLENSAGAGEKIFEIVVETPPYLKRFRVQNLHSNYAIFSIDCYTKYNQDLIRNRVIKFQDGEFQDNEFFFCDLSKRTDRDLSEVSFDLNLPAEFLERDLEIRVVHSVPGVKASLVCEAEGNPTPNLIWRRNDITVPGNQSIFNVDLNQNNGDVFECRAENELGMASKFFIIRIYGKHYNDSKSIQYFYKYQIY